MKVIQETRRTPAAGQRAPGLKVLLNNHKLYAIQQRNILGWSYVVTYYTVCMVKSYNVKAISICIHMDE